MDPEYSELLLKYYELALAICKQFEDFRPIGEEYGWFDINHLNKLEELIEETENLIL